MTTTPRKRSPQQRTNRTRTAMRIIALTGAAPVAFVAGWISYFHITHAAIHYGQDRTTAHMIPVAIDGLMIVATVAMVANRTAWVPRLAFGFGAVLSLGANVLSVTDPNPIAYVFAGSASVSLLLAAEMLVRLLLPTAPVRRVRVRKAPAKKVHARKAAPVRKLTAVTA